LASPIIPQTTSSTKREGGWRLASLTLLINNPHTRQCFSILRRAAQEDAEGLIQNSSTALSLSSTL
jgi:hypothetical protein